MGEFVLLVLKILGGAVGAVIFYRIGFKVLSKFNLLDKDKKYSQRTKYWVSELTQFVIFLGLLGAIILFNRYGGAG